MFVMAFHEPEDRTLAPWLAMSLIRTDANGLVSVRQQVSAPYRHRDCLCASLATRLLPNGPAGETESNRAIVSAFIDAAMADDFAKRIDSFVDHAQFLSHTPESCSRPGRLAELVERRRPRPGLRYHGIDDMVAEGRYVAVFSCFDTDGTHYRVCDLFRLAGDRIAEHWDVIETVAAHTVAHNDQA